jgi:SAM-dependent methyltransferase
LSFGSIRKQIKQTEQTIELMVRFQHGEDHHHKQQQRSWWMRTTMWSIVFLAVLLALTTTHNEQSRFIVQHQPRAATTSTTTTTIRNDYETAIGAPAGETTSGTTATTTHHQDDSRSSATGGGGVVVGSSGGAWTAETHLTQYGFNVDAGLVRVLEASCRDVENARNDGSQWSRHPSLDAPIGGLWRPPAIVDCRVLELGSGVGVYVDALKKDQAKRNRQVFGIEPNRMGGVYERRNGPRQLLVDIMATTDPVGLAKSVLRDQLKKTNGNDDGKFDLLYSIEVCEHMPLDRHEDAAVFLATLARPGTKLIFGAAHPGQGGTGHIGNRKKSEWESILDNVGFVKHEQETLAVAHELDEYNHKVNTQVYYYQPSVTGTSRR